MVKTPLREKSFGITCENCGMCHSGFSKLCSKCKKQSKLWLAKITLSLLASGYEKLSKGIGYTVDYSFAALCYTLIGGSYAGYYLLRGEWYALSNGYKALSNMTFFKCSDTSEIVVGKYAEYKEKFQDSPHHGNLDNRKSIWDRLHEEIHDKEFWNNVLPGYDMPEHPNKYWEIVCPLSHDIMRDPIIINDSQWYDRESIEAWVKTCKDKNKEQTSPKTRNPIDIKENPPYPVEVLEKAIRTYVLKIYDDYQKQRRLHLSEETNSLHYKK